MTIDPCGFVLLLLVLLAWRIWMCWCYQYGQDRAAVAARVERVVKPHTPHDCPTCRQPAAGRVEVATPHARVPPGANGKAGVARWGASTRPAWPAPIPAVPSYRISDAHLHALVGDGVGGGGKWRRD